MPRKLAYRCYTRYTKNWAVSGLFYVLSAPRSLLPPDAVLTLRELTAAVSDDFLAAGAVVERQDGQKFRVEFDMLEGVRLV